MKNQTPKSSPNQSLIKEFLPYFKPLLEAVKKEGIIIQGNAFIGKTKKGKGGIFLRMRFEILKGKPHKKEKLIQKK